MNGSTLARAGVCAIVSLLLAAAPASAAPGITTDGPTPVAATEQQPAQVFKSSWAVTLSDLEVLLGEQIASASVVLTAGGDQADAWSYTQGDSPVTAAPITDGLLLTAPGGASPATFTAALKQVRFTPGADAPTTPKTYRVRVTDTGLGPQSDEVTNTIDVTNVNDAPTLTAGAGSATYTEDGAPTPIAPGLTISDPDSVDMDTAVVSFTAGRQAGDRLVIPPITGVQATGTESSTSRTLTFNPHLSASDAQAVLRQVAFAATGDAPVAAARTLSFTVNDGGLDSAPSTRQVTVTPVNDLPTAALGSGAQYVEDGDPVAVAPQGTVADPDSDVTGLTVTIGSGADPERDRLSLAGEPPAGIVASVSDDAISFSGTASPSAYTQALRSVRYRDAQTVSGPDRDVTVQAVPKDAGGAGAAAGTVIHSVARDDPPTIATSDGSATYVEDGPGVVVDDGLTVADEEGSQVQGAQVAAPGQCLGHPGSQTEGIDIVAADCTVTLSGAGSTADYQAELRRVTFTSQAQRAETDSVTFTLTGGATATRTVAVQNVDDAPVAAFVSPGAAGWDRSRVPVAIDPELAVSDVDDDELAGASVAIVDGFVQDEDVLALDGAFEGISAAYAGGVLTLSGSAPLERYRDALRAVTYHSTNDLTTPGERRVRVTVSDGEASSAPAERAIAVARAVAAPFGVGVRLARAGARPVLLTPAASVPVGCVPSRPSLARCSVTVSLADGTSLGSATGSGPEVTVALDDTGKRLLAQQALGVAVVISVGAVSTDGAAANASQRAFLLRATKTRIAGALFRGSFSAKLSSRGRFAIGGLARGAAPVRRLTCRVAVPGDKPLAKRRAKSLCKALRSAGARPGRFVARGVSAKKPSVQLLLTP